MVCTLDQWHTIPEELEVCRQKQIRRKTNGFIQFGDFVPSKIRLWNKNDPLPHQVGSMT